MEIHHLDASLIRQAFLAGAAELDAKKDWINELNVFPVPDGDTGTNMTLTIMTAAKDVSGLETGDLRSLCKAISPLTSASLPCVITRRPLRITVSVVCSVACTAMDVSSSAVFSV